MRYVIFSVVFLLLFTPSTASYTAPEPQNRSINDLITEYASRYGVSEKVVHKVINCESRYNPNAVGDGGKSYGLVQIHLPSHPSISKANALDSEYAINFLAKKLSQGQGRLWTCYRIYFS